MWLNMEKWLLIEERPEASPLWSILGLGVLFESELQKIEAGVCVGGCLSRTGAS